MVQARSQVWIWWGGAFLAKEDLSACFVGESGIFCAYLGIKWTFSPAFLEKVDIFAYSPHVGGMFPEKILKNMIEKHALRDIMILLYSIPICD